MSHQHSPRRTVANLCKQTGTLRSHSSASSYKDFDDDEADSPSISRSRLHPDEARSHFSPAQIDARDVDFSDRVNGKRKSYKASSRRQQKREDGTEVLGDISDEEDGESLERKLARLRREIEEVKEESRKRNYEKQKANGTSDDVDGGDEAVNLSKMLDSISVSHGKSNESVGARLAKSLGSSIKSTEPPKTANTMQKEGEATTYTVTYAPDYQQSHTFARAADFDSRLTLLEKALGITSTALPAFDSKGVPMAVLPTLDRLQRQIAVISEASPSSLDSISRRVRTLTQEAERLDEARKSAKVAQEELRAANGDTPTRTGDGEDGGDSEQVAKINALYGTLGTIENLAPILPSLLDRLRSLRAIHTDAAKASETLERVAKKQEDMAADIKKWREGLEKVEQAMKQSETVMGGNMKVVEGWVKDLEERMAQF